MKTYRYKFKFFKNSFKRIKHWLDYSPPDSLSSKGWRLFKEEFKQNAPIRYWLHNDFDKMFNPIRWKYRSMKEWFRYRTYDRYHVIQTGLPPSYYDVSTQILHVNFNMLKDFVEVEQASQTFWWGDEAKKASWCMKHMPFYRFFYPFRRPDLGIKHFEWAATLDDPKLPPHEQSPGQANAAREILDLYDWWVNRRPARKEVDYPPYNNQGLGDMLACFDDDFDRTAPDYVEHEKAVSKSVDQEREWDQEDEDMLIRLMKIRDHLWT